MSDKVTEAFEVLKKAIKEDVGEGSLAHSWHCNIAMMCADAMHEDDMECMNWDDAHRIGNDAASRFMQMCFDVKTA